MIEIDGSKGGGQMLRTALTLSAVKSEGFRMGNIRGSRSNPGLKNQHLECVKTMERICDAETEGAELNSEELVFRPEEMRNESFTANIGTAGSVTLLLDTVLPVTSQFSSGFGLTAKGGTDVKWSPTLDYLKHVKLPLLRSFGVKAEVDRARTGYYSAGGGEVELNTEEHSLEKINISDRGELRRFKIYSRSSKELQEQEVADRQAYEAARKLKNSHTSVPIDKTVSYEETDSPGSSLLVKAVYENSIVGFDALGEKGKKAEKVAQEATQEFKSFHSSEAAVDEYMADQLLVFMAVIGGEIRVPGVNSHVQTSLEVLRMFGSETVISDETDPLIELTSI
jgi:RNA 3'-terminal phosphate cyclase (ATP)